ncbi:MAG: hypothetical protein ACREU2_05105 [Steroidobacteraceae bacterium]
MLRQDLKEALERREETDAITREREAFRQYQATMMAIDHQFVSRNAGVPTISTESECLARVKASEAAHAKWLEAKAIADRILDEIRSGKRQ